MQNLPLTLWITSDLVVLLSWSVHSLCVRMYPVVITAMPKVFAISLIGFSA